MALTTFAPLSVVKNYNSVSIMPHESKTSLIALAVVSPVWDSSI